MHAIHFHILILMVSTGNDNNMGTRNCFFLDFFLWCSFTIAYHISWTFNPLGFSHDCNPFETIDTRTNIKSLWNRNLESRGIAQLFLVYRIIYVKTWAFSQPQFQLISAKHKIDYEVACLLMHSQWWPLVIMNRSSKRPFWINANLSFQWKTIGR